MLNRPGPWVRPAITAAAAAACLVPGAALAHSVVVETIPAAGSTVAPPATVTVRFNENIRTEFVYTRLMGPGGEFATTNTVKGTDLVAKPQVQLRPGAYKLSYRIASGDTHPVAGTLSFTVKGGASTSPTSVPGTATPTATMTTMAPAPATSSTAAAPATSSTATKAADQESGKETFWTKWWPLVTVAAVAAAIGGWFAGRKARRGNSYDHKH